MKHFEMFCLAARKNKHGYVPDIIDLVSNSEKDWAVVSYLRDNGVYGLATHYNFLSEDAKNHLYSQFESEIQDAIDKFNDKIDYEKELMKEPETYAGEYCYAHFNQSLWDAGHQVSDFS